MHPVAPSRHVALLLGLTLQAAAPVLAAIPLCAALAGPVAAQPAAAPQPAAGALAPMTAAEFDAFSRGKTLYYEVDGQPYGAEQYLPDHQVIWAFLGQDCRRGSWYSDTAGHLCFLYETDPGAPQCWDFFAGPTGLRAHFAGTPAGVDTIAVTQSASPLQCPGPQVGV